MMTNISTDRELFGNDLHLPAAFMRFFMETRMIMS